MEIFEGDSGSRASRLKINTGRRRRFTEDEKLRIVAESFAGRGRASATPVCAMAIDACMCSSNAQVGTPTSSEPITFAVTWGCNCATRHRNVLFVVRDRLAQSAGNLAIRPGLDSIIPLKILNEYDRMAS